MEDENRLLSIKEMAHILGVSRAQIYIYANQEKNPLPLVKLSTGVTRIIYSDLIDWMNLQLKEKIKKQ